MSASLTPPPLTYEQTMKFGTQITRDGVRFRLWAPQCESVSLRLIESQKTTRMTALPRGWFEVSIVGIGDGAKYLFVMEDGSLVPDPASRFQPQDVDGASQVIDPRTFEWTDRGWPGRPWEEAIIYEIHIGCFTEEGTFRAAIDKLDHLIELGVTMIELMPIADFKGRWNWGYDGSLLFAPDSSYGRPEDLKALINAAHIRGISVILDVVYNHFGPQGNYLGVYAPVFSPKHETPWGSAVNFDDDGASVVREFIYANARYWLNEYRFDGLRFDAIHEIKDDGPKHVLQDLAEQIRASTDGRHIHLVAENSANQAGWLKRKEDGTPWLYTAQWANDIHHCLHTAATGESFLYYADYVGRRDLLARSLAEGLAWQGEYMEYEQETKGEPSSFLPATAFVSFLQDHDEIGNRPGGERIHLLANEQACRTMTAIVLLSPQIPLLFMGEEWAADQPFLFFSDMADLAEEIRQQRREQLRSLPNYDRMTDPMSRQAFAKSKLDWGALSKDGHRRYLSLYRRLIGIRAEQIAPRLGGMRGNSGSYELLGSHGVKVSWILGDKSTLSLFANLSDEPLDDVNVWSGDHLWLEGFASGDSLAAWSAVFTLRSPQVRTD